jgi:hypothetical protein
MKLFIPALFTLVSVSAFAQPASYFTADEEGWTALCECGNHPNSSWAPVAGSPGGAFKGTDDANGTWYYNSPAAFDVDLSTYYGGTLKFDQKQNSNTSQTNEPDVMFVKSDGTKIVYSTPSNPSHVAWTSYSITLTESGWTHSILGGTAVTYSEFVDFLTNFSVIKIRGDYSSSTSETCWIDNVVLATPPVLPIELAEFTGTLQGNSTAVINWATMTEQNVNHFAIQKSSNLGQNFETIGKVTAIGNSTIEHDYVFTDENCVGETYYRLLVVDNDNTFNYSPIIVVSGNEVTTGEIELFPNPADHHIVINNNIFGFTAETITITDLYGRVVTQFTGVEQQRLKLDISDLSEGMYFVTLNNNTSAYSAPFQVIR